MIIVGKDSIRLKHIMERTANLDLIKRHHSTWEA